MRTEQAMKILRVAEHANGKYLQKYKPSNFGRMYYEGLSIQNVSKEIRGAMLGDCWEYDIRSSVIAFKLSIANELLLHINCKEDARRVFALSYYYVEKKDCMIAEIRNETFGANEDLTRDKQVELIKQALTAIGFGATVKETGWRNDQGEWVKSSIQSILRNRDQRSRFLNHYAVKYFIQEQAIFDEYICSYVKANRPDIWNSDLVKAKKQVSRSKVVAWVYQHMETIAMDAARKAILATGNQVLASIHDAVIVKRRLKKDDFCDVLEAMQIATSNPHLRLKATQHERYKRFSIEPEDEIDLRFNKDELLQVLAIKFPDGNVPDEFDISTCFKEI
jgi:hypothetical protein